MTSREARRGAAQLLWQQGMRNAAHAARLTGVPERTMRSYFGKLLRGESLEDRPRSGRPRKLTEAMKRRLQRIKSRHPRETSAFYAARFEEETGLRLGLETIRRALHSMGYKWRLPRQRRLTGAQRAARVAFAAARLNDAWAERWSMDESTFNLYRNRNRYWVRVRTSDAEDEPSFPRLSEAQEVVSLSIVVAICRGRKSAIGFLPRNWRAADLETVFDRDVFPSLRWSNRTRHENELIMDNDGRHLTRVWRDYVQRRRLRPLSPWPANSPDLNPIENVFAWLKRNVQHAAPTDEGTLRAAIVAAWNSVPLEFTENLIDSMPRRLRECSRLHGGRTKY
jgi:transposase